MALLAHVFLRDLQFDRFVGVRQASEERRNRFTHLEINRPVFDLHKGVVIECAVERVKVVVGGFGTIVFQVVPIEVVVVNECAVEDHTAVRLECARDHIGRVGVSAVVSRRPGTSLGIGFYDKASKIRDQFVNAVDFLFPPVRDSRVERIESIEVTENLGTAQIDRQSEAHAPGPENVSDAPGLGEKRLVENTRVGVYVVDGTAVDSDRSQQPSVFSSASQIFADATVGEKYRRTAVATLDAAVKIVPLIDPADRRVGLLSFVEHRDVLGACDLAEQREDAVQNAAVRGAGDDDAVVPVHARFF